MPQSNYILYAVHCTGSCNAEFFTSLEDVAEHLEKTKTWDLCKGSMRLRLFKLAEEIPLEQGTITRPQPDKVNWFYKLKDAPPTPQIDLPQTVRKNPFMRD